MFVETDHQSSSSALPLESYRPPVLREGKTWYIEYYCYNPILKKLQRIRIKFNRIKSIGERRKQARQVLLRLNARLASGWNPFTDGSSRDFLVLSSVFDEYVDNCRKLLERGMMRQQTADNYISRCNNLRRYSEEQQPITYLYELSRGYIVKFLDYILLVRGNSERTRNNYLLWINIFCGWCVDRGYLATRPTTGIKRIDKRLIKKQREAIPLADVKRIADWLLVNDRPFLLAAYILYYCFVRPVEMTRLKIGDFNLQAGILTLSGAISKNKTTQTVTLPKKVIEYAVSLGVFNHPSDYYLFSDGLLPGETKYNPVVFRHHWEKVRTALNLPSSWQFYSLKDTGITEMLGNKLSSISVRDQARHSSLSITEIYASHTETANPVVSEYNGSL